MPERGRQGLLGRVLQEVEHRTGMAVVDRAELAIQEQAVMDLRATWRELDLLGYAVLDYFSGNASELRPEARRGMARKSLVAWMNDPQAYRAVETLNDFTFGRGVPQPRAKDKAVQRVLDDFWNDTDNKILLTTSEGQKRLGRDLSIQSNVFLLIFADGDDGKVKVGLLGHDSVESVVRDQNNRLRILYYTAREAQMVWNYTTDRYERPNGSLTPPLKYYEHYANVQALQDGEVAYDAAPPEKMGEGRVYHLVENVTTEMAFGVPMMQRTLRWFAAYNDFMAARVDMMKAAAAFIMKRKIKGTPNQLVKQATKAISMSGPLAGSMDGNEIPIAGRAGSIMNENDMVSHESLKIDSGAANAVQDSGMLHTQISAGSGLPKHYLGEPDANLATATALELPVLKIVESRQETVEALFRALLDMAIQRAVDTGQLDRYASEEEEIADEVDDAYIQQAASKMIDSGKFDESEREELVKLLREAYEDSADDEDSTQRDLSYEFSMPSPLRRMMTDLVTSIQGLAQTFDPNNTNIELSRVLLAIALGEALEVDDPADLVERIFPPGYVDPLITMAAQATASGGGQTPPDSATTAGAGGDSYGAKQSATMPEKVPNASEATFTIRGRDGNVVSIIPLRETARDDEVLSARIRGRSVGLDYLFDSEVGAVATAELEALAMASANGGRMDDDVSE
jgi:hypothetical protein